MVTPSARCSADLEAHFLAQLRVEVGQGLVHQAHRRFGDNGATERDALLLAAGELSRLAVEQRRKSEHVGDALEPAVAVGIVHVAHAEAENDVLGDRKMRNQRVRLEHHGDVALRGRQARDIVAADEDTARIGVVETGDQAQRRRLAATGGAEQHVERSRSSANEMPSTARTCPAAVVQCLATFSTAIADTIPPGAPASESFPALCIRRRSPS
jgi:porphobilinogen deaminase